MKSKIILFISLWFIGYSSRDKTTDEANKSLIRINLDERTEDAANLFSYDSSIVLETIEESLIVQIDRIEFYNNKIYILDSKQNCVFIFDQNGRFDYKINRRRKSPEEYLSVQNFYIHKEEQKIYLYDGLAGGIIVVDLFGYFLYRIKVEKGYSFFRINQQEYVFYLANGVADGMDKTFNNFMWNNNDFVLIKEEFPFHEELIGRRHTTRNTKSVFSVYNEQIYILPLLSNRIYTYSPALDKIILRYEIEYSLKEYNQIIDNQTEFSELNNYIKGVNEGNIPSRLNNFLKIGDAVFYNFSFKGQPLLCFYDEDKDETKLCKFGLHENGLLFGVPSIYFTDTKDERELSIMEGSVFEFCKNKGNANNEIIQEIGHKLGNVENPNPILVFFR